MRPSHTVPTAVQVLPAPPAPSWPLSVAPKTSQALQTPQNTPKHPPQVYIGNILYNGYIISRRSSGRRPDAMDADGSFRPSVASPSWVSLMTSRLMPPSIRSHRYLSHQRGFCMRSVDLGEPCQPLGEADKMVVLACGCLSSWNSAAYGIRMWQLRTGPQTGRGIEPWARASD